MLKSTIYNPLNSKNPQFEKNPNTKRQIHIRNVNFSRTVYDRGLKYTFCEDLSDEWASII